MHTNLRTVQTLNGPLFVSTRERRRFLSHFAGRHGGDCGCGCGPVCCGWRAPLNVALAHQRALADLFANRQG